MAWFGIRVNTFANSRTAFASLTGKAWPCNSIPLKAGMSIGMMLISIELVLMLFIRLFVPGDYAGCCVSPDLQSVSRWAQPKRLRGRAESSLKIADIGADLMKIVFKIEGRRRAQPERDRGLHRRQRGGFGGPKRGRIRNLWSDRRRADHIYPLEAVKDPLVQVQLLVWIFVMRVMMVVSSAVSSTSSTTLVAKSKYGNVPKMNFEAPAPPRRYG